MLVRVNEGHLGTAEYCDEVGDVEEGDELAGARDTTVAVAADELSRLDEIRVSLDDLGRVGLRCALRRQQIGIVHVDDE